VPSALEDLEMVDLGDGICVRMPNPCGKWMPKSVSETVVSQKKTSESNFVEAWELGKLGNPGSIQPFLSIICVQALSRR